MIAIVDYGVGNLFSLRCSFAAVGYDAEVTSDPEALRRALKGGVLELLGIPEFLKVPVGKMSEGMKKRLSIGCALANNPGILLLDEPSAALDLVCKAAILDYFRMFRDRGGILLIATHDPQELELCTDYRMLRNGVAEEYAYRGDLRKLSEDLKL